MSTRDSSERGQPGPVFITGVPRCGSSWIGQIIGSLPGNRYVYEPFNMKWEPRLEGTLSYFHYLTPLNYVPEDLAEIAGAAFHGKQNLKRLFRAAYRGYLRPALRAGRPRVVVKDPTAPLMTAWIAQAFQATPVVITRHPCGFASSMHALGWQLDIQHLLRQPRLLEDHLEPYIDCMEAASGDEWLTRGTVWAAIHTVLLRQMRDHDDWVLCNYEDFCRDPATAFAGLARQLAMPLTAGDLKGIERRSDHQVGDSGSTFKHSASMEDIWRSRLSPGQVDAVMGAAREFGFDAYPIAPAPAGPEIAGQTL